MSVCIECFGPPKSTCLNTRCPYRRHSLDAALALFTAETTPDPLEELDGLCPECRNPLDGGDMSCISSECRFYGRVGLDEMETKPGKRVIATGNRYGFTAVDEDHWPEYQIMRRTANNGS